MVEMTLQGLRGDLADFNNCHRLAIQAIEWWCYETLSGSFAVVDESLDSGFGC